MKYPIIYLVCAFALCAQSTAPTPAADKAPEIAPDTVVLKVNGKPVTAAEVKHLVSIFSPEIQKSAMTNPQQVFQSYFLLESLSRQALAEKLEETSPVKEQLELQRMQFLATTILNREPSRIHVSEEDQRKRYEADKDTKYEQAKIRAILVMFADRKTIAAQMNMSDPSSPKLSEAKAVRQEPEAKEIAESIVKQVREGADFETLAREKSDDKSSAQKGGEFGTIRRGDRIPDEVKQAVFALKPGEVSDPIRQTMGYYILKLESRSIQPFGEVKQQVENDVRQERFQQWMSGLQKQFEVTIEAPAFFPGAPVAIPGPAPVPKPAK
jgi:peptidyl-prolyl cis-trans isomerase C